MASKSQKSKPTISVSFPSGQRELCMTRLRSIVTNLKNVPGTKVESQSGLVRAMVLGGEIEKREDGMYLSFKVVEGD